MVRLRTASLVLDWKWTRAAASIRMELHHIGLARESQPKRTEMQSPADANSLLGLVVTLVRALVQLAALCGEPVLRPLLLQMDQCPLPLQMDQCPLPLTESKMLERRNGQEVVFGVHS